MGEEKYSGAGIVLVSALEHYSYCPRQCGLIYIDQVYDENVFTLRGKYVHERVDEAAARVEAGVRVETALPLFSDRLGMVGKADLVEFHGGVPYPVEYKHGLIGKYGHDDLQVCAQAMCLEEMLGCEVPKGAVYHYSSRRRREVFFDRKLRLKVMETVKKVRAMLEGETLPEPVNDGRCRNCSLNESCMPGEVAERKVIKGLAGSLFRLEEP